LTPHERAEIESLLESRPSFIDLPFEDFCSTYLVIQDKQGQLVPLQLNRAQLDLVDHLTGRDIVLKARQLGMSTVIQAWLFWQQLRGGARTSTLCHEDELTSILRLMADRFYNELPDELRPVRKYANAKLTTYADLNSEGSIATVGGTAGSRKGRGGSLTFIHGSEVAFWPDAQGVLSAAMQAGNPAIILESTPNGMTGWFYEQCMAALDGSGVWTLHFFPWWYDELYQIPMAPGETLTYSEDELLLMTLHGLTAEQIKWRRSKQRELPHTFKQEYPEDPYSCFLASGISFFGDIEHVYTAPLDVDYNPDHQYVGGLDFAQTGDYTELTILDTTTAEQVDQLHINNLEWQEMRRRISFMVHYWHAEVLGEGNSMGTTNIELLQKGELLDDGTRIKPIKLRVFQTTAQSKPPLVQGLYHALHNASLKLQDRSFQKHQLRAFISKQLPSGAWQYEAAGGAHDDFVISLALAWHGANHRVTSTFARNPFYG
jgi:hypothetical protein